MELKERICELERIHGSLRAAARALQIDAGYLSRLKSGKKDNPSDKLLKRMGLSRLRCQYHMKPYSFE